MYTEMFEYVTNLLESRDRDLTSVGKTKFRKRSEHIERVFMWAQRLMEDEENIDREAVLASAIFHDAGYIYVEDDYKKHAAYSAEICREYLSEHGFNQNFTNKVVYLVENHSEKELMQLTDTSKELIFLMEADLLDETGALSILWDCMIEGAEDVQSFKNTYSHIIRYTGKQLDKNPMVTSKGRKFWKEKQKLIKDFINQLSCDLGIEKSFTKSSQVL